MNTPLTPSLIRQDGGTQPRAELRVETIDDYCQAMIDGATFPPIVVFYDGRVHWLACGFHRLRAWVKAFQDKPIEADVRQGTLLEAQWFSYGANKEHDTSGTRRGKGDIERAVLAALSHPKAKTLSNELVAEHIGCSLSTVKRHCKAAEAATRVNEPSGRPAHRTGKDGRKINTAKIGKGRKPKPVTPEVERSSSMPVAWISIPHEPSLAALALRSTFDVPFLIAIADEIYKVAGKSAAVVAA